MPELSLLDNETILIEYCDGDIRKTETFLDGDPLGDGPVRAWRLQPVITAGLSTKGRAIC
jgi:hypothetical protein